MILLSQMMAIFNIHFGLIPYQIRMKKDLLQSIRIIRAKLSSLKNFWLMRKVIKSLARKILAQGSLCRIRITLLDPCCKIVEDQLRRRESSKQKFPKREKVIDNNYLKRSQPKKKTINNLQLRLIKNHSRRKILSFLLLLLKNSLPKEMEDYKQKNY